LVYGPEPAIHGYPYVILIIFSTIGFGASG
jgi:hypothetical protein